MQKEDSIHSLSDTGYDISISACIIAPSKPVVIVDDTELVILLQHCFSPTMHDTIYLQPSTNLADISILQKHIDPDPIQSLLLIHALSGCDKTVWYWGKYLLWAYNVILKNQQKYS